MLAAHSVHDPAARPRARDPMGHRNDDTIEDTRARKYSKIPTNPKPPKDQKNPADWRSLQRKLQDCIIEHFVLSRQLPYATEVKICSIAVPVGSGLITVKNFKFRISTVHIPTASQYNRVGVCCGSVAVVSFPLEAKNLHHYRSCWLWSRNVCRMEFAMKVEDRCFLTPGGHFKFNINSFYKYH